MSENDSTLHHKVMNPPKMSVIERVLRGVPQEWIDLMDVKELSKIIEQIEEEPLPSWDLVFEVFRLTPLQRVCVVLIGQDPYPTPGYAHGLSFSCKVGIPMSLRRIYECMLASGVLSQRPTTGDLTPWAGEGVLMLNRAFTISSIKGRNHMNLWKDFTQKLIHKLDDLYPDLVYLLWGNFAQQTQTKGIRLCWSHPSPLCTKPFISCDHFKRLEKMFQPKINWDIINQPKAPTRVERHNTSKISLTSWVKVKPIVNYFWVWGGYD